MSPEDVNDVINDVLKCHTDKTIGEVESMRCVLKTNAENYVKEMRQQGWLDDEIVVIHSACLESDGSLSTDMLLALSKLYVKCYVDGIKREK